ncbi:MAG: hypothetical protein ABW193_07050 [Luteibacter sp.]
MKPLALAGLGLIALLSGTAHAASSKGCEGGGFSILGRTAGDISIPANAIGSTFHVQGRYVQFDVDADSLAVRNYALTGAPNAKDVTGGVPTPVFASKVPDHRGLVLSGPLQLELDKEDVTIARDGSGLAMTVTAKDCAQGGIFQMEVERADGTATVVTHTLASDAGTLTPFYFDNRNFRNREGDVLPFKDTTVKVASRINFGNDFSSRFVGRDSPQLATRIDDPACPNSIVTRTGGTAQVNHCGAVSRWLVSSGGRMGMLFGEDSVEVAPPATACSHQCKGQDKVQGAAVVLGAPFPVAAPDRLQPRQ